MITEIQQILLKIPVFLLKPPYLFAFWIFYNGSWVDEIILYHRLLMCYIEPIRKIFIVKSIYYLIKLRRFGSTLFMPWIKTTPLQTLAYLIILTLFAWAFIFLMIIRPTRLGLGSDFLLFNLIYFSIGTVLIFQLSPGSVRCLGSYSYGFTIPVPVPR